MELQPQGALVGQRLDGKVELERLIFADSVAERYAGTLVDSGSRVRVLVFNQRFEPEADRADLLKATNALIGAPIPASIAGLERWELGAKPAYLVERAEPGAPLKTLIAERGGLDWKLALRLTCNLARALEWMEQLGVVHRALHPGAIIVTDIQSGKLQVAEWALGVLAHNPDPMGQAQAGELVPYPEYMPPEKISERGRSDRKSLVYQMGLLLHEMIAGKPAFGGSEDVDILKRHLHERPAKLSVLRGDAGMPDAIEDLLEMMLDRSPDKRFQMPGAAVNALSSLLPDATPADFPALQRPEAELAAEPAKPAPKKEELAEEGGGKRTLIMTALSAQEPSAAEPAKPAATAVAAPIKGAAQVDDASKPTEQMDMSVLGADRKAPEKTPEKPAEKKAGAPVEVYDPEANKGDKPSTIILSRDFSGEAAQEAAPAAAAPAAEPQPATSTIVISKDFSEEAGKKSAAGGISGSSGTTTDPISFDEPKKKKKTGKQKAITSPDKVEDAALAATAAAPAVAPKVDEAAAKKKADEEAAAKKKADEEAAQAAKKKADEEAAKKKAEADAKQRLAEAQKKAEQTQPELKQSASAGVDAKPRKTMGMRALGATDGEADAWFLDTEQAEMAIEQAEVRDIEESSARRTKTILIALAISLVLGALLFIVIVNTIDFGKGEEEDSALPAPPSPTRLV